MRTTIVRMTRYGRVFRVQLGCGCSFESTLDQARRDQLFIGKPVNCVECGEERL